MNVLQYVKSQVNVSDLTSRELSAPFDTQTFISWFDSDQNSIVLGLINKRSTDDPSTDRS